MKWAPGERDSVTNNPYYFKSDCGRYTITIPLGENTIYLAYRKAPEGSRIPAALLGGYESSKAAKSACEAHLLKTTLAEA